MLAAQRCGLPNELLRIALCPLLPHLHQACQACLQDCQGILETCNYAWLPGQGHGSNVAGMHVVACRIVEDGIAGS